MKRLPTLLGGMLILGCGSTDGGAGTSSTTVTPPTTSGDSNGTDSATGDSSGTTGGTTGAATTGDPSSTTGTPTTDGGSSGGAVFIEDPDGGSGTVECDVWSQDCSPGEKCMPWANDGGNSWNATKCSPVDANPAQPGDTCTTEGGGVSGVDNCDVAAMCWGVDPETNEGYCVDFCKGSEAAPMCDNPATACTIYNDGVLPLCLPGCDPLLQDCANMDVCVATASGDEFVCVLDASGDGGIAGDPCEYVNVCDPGLYCANADAVPNCAGSVGCCSEFCDLSAADPGAACTCAAGGCECVPWFEAGMEPPGLGDVGACVIPA